LLVILATPVSGSSMTGLKTSWQLRKRSMFRIAHGRRLRTTALGIGRRSGDDSAKKYVRSAVGIH
jgi:hypothetical protein